MRLASFNLETLTDSPGHPVPLDERLDLLRPQLTRLAADVLCLQEADATKDEEGERHHFALESLLEGTVYADFHQASTLEPSTGRPRDKHNLVVLSRWPITAMAQYKNDLAPPPVYRPVTADPANGEDEPVIWDRPILHATIDLPDGRPLHVIDTHLRAPLAAFVAGQKIGQYAWKSVAGWAEGYFLAAMKRAGQALEARLLVDRLFDDDPHALIVVAGDFNSVARETPLRIVAGDTEDTRSGRLAARALVMLEHSLPEDRRFTVIHRGQRLMLDHLLVSRPLMAHYRGMEVHNEALGDELVAYTLIDGAPDSYHAPIVADFDMG